jgi:hypothetical protein
MREAEGGCRWQRRCGALDSGGKPGSGSFRSWQAKAPAPRWRGIAAPDTILPRIAASRNQLVDAVGGRWWLRREPSPQRRKDAEKAQSLGQG